MDRQTGGVQRLMRLRRAEFGQWAQAKSLTAPSTNLTKSNYKDINKNN